MHIRLATIVDREAWDAFVIAQPMGSFMQSWDWGEFLEAQHRPIWRFIVTDNHQHVHATMLVYRGMLRGKGCFLYSPRGPVVCGSVVSVWPLIEQQLTSLAEEQHAWYAQCDPLTEDATVVAPLIATGWDHSRDSVQPRSTLIMDITPTKEALLSGMHSKARYNINLAQRKGVQVVIDNTKLDDFFRLLHNTEQRQHVHFYSKEYFEKLLQSPMASLYCARYKGELVAANLMIRWGNTMTYLFGGTDHTYRQVMAPHLLQWQAMLDAQTHGCTRYDFWGAAPEGATGKEATWVGITRFKQGFIPTVPLTTYVGTFEKVYRPFLVKGYRLAQKLVS